jgi:tetratricopeptide (TPR) repeat protein
MSELNPEEWVEREFARRLVEVKSPASAYFGVGYSAMIEGEYDRACIAYAKAVDHAPNNALYRHMLGLTYADLSNCEKAIDYFKKAIELNCNGLTVQIPEENPYYHLGWCLEDLGKVEEAERAYRQSIEHVPGHYDSYLRLGRLYHRAGKFEQAVNVYQAAYDFYTNFNSAMLDRLAFKNMKFNLERAQVRAPYQEYKPTEEEKVLDVKLSRLVGQRETSV